MWNMETIWSFVEYISCYGERLSLFISSHSLYIFWVISNRFTEADILYDQSDRLNHWGFRLANWGSLKWDFFNLLIDLNLFLSSTCCNEKNIPALTPKIRWPIISQICARAHQKDVTKWKIPCPYLPLISVEWSVSIITSITVSSLTSNLFPTRVSHSCIPSSGVISLTFNFLWSLFQIDIIPSRDARKNNEMF